MGKEAETPDTPDYSSLARQTSAMDQAAARDQTRANRPNQYNPWGSITWENNQTTERQFDADAYAAALDAYSKANDKQKAPQQYIYDTTGGADNARYVKNPAYEQWLANQGKGAPNREDFYRDMQVDNWTQRQTLDPRLQAILDTQFGTQGSLMNQIAASLSSPFDMSNMGNVRDVMDPGFGAVQEVQDAMMGRLGSSLQQGRAQEVQRLKAQGITEGSPAWQAAMQSLNQKDVDANQQALLGAMGAYGDIFNRGLAARQQDIGDRQRNISDALMQRQLPRNEYSALLSGGSVQQPSFAGYTQGTGWSAPNMLQAGHQQYQADLGAANARSASAAQGRQSGAAMGATVGSAFGPIGTVVGGLFGGLLGG
ncbi:MAG: hypothetical protein E6Q97_17875 [Desulfurellales bacterium]|nr:MAG: hypothetical protein E6Q97_17875 [Desulfurellales bacterium]